MIRRTLSLAAILAVAGGCTHTLANTAPAVAPVLAQATPAPAPAPAEPLAIAPAEAPSSVALAAGQTTGDFVVYRFSGSFHRYPITLTQRVISVDGPTMVIQSTIADGGPKRTVRATFDKTPGRASELVSAARVDDEGESRISISAYEAFMSETMLSADDNQGETKSENVKVAVGGKEIDAVKTSYRVLVGSKHATMSSTTSSGFAWGDIGGEIRSDDGKILYRVEVIESGNAHAATP
jgi:hypothetical protein